MTWFRLKIFLGNTHQRNILLLLLGRLSIFFYKIPHKHPCWNRCCSKPKFMPECLQMTKLSSLSNFKFSARLKWVCVEMEQTIVGPWKQQTLECHSQRQKPPLLLPLLVRFKTFQALLLYSEKGDVLSLHRSKCSSSSIYIQWFSSSQLHSCIPLVQTWQIINSSTSISLS